MRIFSATVRETPGTSYHHQPTSPGRAGQRPTQKLQGTQIRHHLTPPHHHHHDRRTRPTNPPPTHPMRKPHCKGYRAAAVASSAAVRSLGVDAEPHAALPADTLALVATVSERQHLRRLALEQSVIAFDRLLFSIKESIYKVWFPLVRAWIDFDDANVQISRDGCFSASVGLPNHGAIQCVGRWRASRGFLVTMAGIKQNGILGRPLRDSWLASAEHLA